jgi:hypothetical protein
MRTSPTKTEGKSTGREEQTVKEDFCAIEMDPPSNQSQVSPSEAVDRRGKDD